MGLLGFKEKEFFNINFGKVSVPKIKTRKFNGIEYSYLNSFVSKKPAEIRKKALREQGFLTRITEGKAMSGANKGKTVYRLWGAGKEKAKVMQKVNTYLKNELKKNMVFLGDNWNKLNAKEKKYVESIDINRKRGNVEIKHINKIEQIVLKYKPKLMFGYGYDPEKLRNGIQNVKYSHTIDRGKLKGLKIYEFEPRLSYRIFDVLAKEMGYKFNPTELVKGKTSIKAGDFVTDKPSKTIVKEINAGIKKIFDKYEPIPKNK